MVKWFIAQFLQRGKFSYSSFCYHKRYVKESFQNILVWRCCFSYLSIERTKQNKPYTQKKQTKPPPTHRCAETRELMYMQFIHTHKTKDNLKIMRKQVVNNQYQTIFVVWNQGTASHDDFSTFITRNRKKIIANCALLIYPVHGVRTHNTLDCKLQRFEGSHSCGKQSTIKKKINSTVYRH